jgi:superfamily II DNA or RNA helicase
MTHLEADDVFDLNPVASALEEVEMYGEKEVRWYQVAARNAVEIALEENPKARILVVLPTGAGKTITSGLIFSSRRIRHALGVPETRKMRVLFIAHKHRLLTQAEQAYADAEGVELILQSAFSALPQELLDEGWDVTCIDEAHHEAMSTIQYHLELLGDKPIIGLTATPDRADGCLIKFDVIVNPISREEAVEQGFLAPTRIHTFVDVPSKDKIAVLTDIFMNYHQEMGQTMVFVKTKREVTAITELLNSMGYEAVGILNQSKWDVDFALDEFSAGNIKFIVNCNKINEGVDVKGCTDVVLGRQFGSYPQLNQVIGRASRPDSDCNVWELVNPLSGRNLDTTVVVGTPEFHRLVSKEGGKWVERHFDYITHRSSKQLGIASGIRIMHH